MCKFVPCFFKEVFLVRTAFYCKYVIPDGLRSQTNLLAGLLWEKKIPLGKMKLSRVVTISIKYEKSYPTFARCVSTQLLMQTNEAHPVANRITYKMCVVLSV